MWKSQSLYTSGQRHSRGRETVGGIKKKGRYDLLTAGREWSRVKQVTHLLTHSLSPLQGRRGMQKNKGDMYSLLLDRKQPRSGLLFLSLFCAYRLSERSSQLLQWETRTLCTPRTHLLHLPFLSPKEACHASRSMLISYDSILQRSDKVWGSNYP